MIAQPKVTAVPLKALGLTSKVAAGIGRPKNVAMAGMAAQKAAPVAQIKPQPVIATTTAYHPPAVPGAVAMARHLATAVKPTVQVLAPHVHQALSAVANPQAAQQPQDVAEQPAAAVMTPANRYHVTPHGKPLFTSEGNYKAAYAFFSPYAKPGPYMTQLNAPQERAFDAWVQQYHVPFNTGAAIADYDMRGYWQSSGGKPYTQGTHFPDTWKTPYDTTFSRESKYSSANNPFDWVGQKLINIHTGKIIFEGSD